MEFVSGSIFVRPMGTDGKGLTAGEVVGGHTHFFDHTSIFFNGRWHVKKWEPDGSLRHDFHREGPFFLLIEAQARHEFRYLGPGTGIAWCVYSHRTAQGEVSVEETGWMPAYEADTPAEVPGGA